MSNYGEKVYNYVTNRISAAKIADFLLTKAFKKVSKYTSISEIFGVQWLAHIDVEDSTSKRKKFGAADESLRGTNIQLCDKQRSG